MFDELRKLLRVAVKEEQSEAKNVNAKENVSEKSSNDSELSDSGSESEMADNTTLSFSVEKNDWETFTEQLELYFIEKSITDEKFCHKKGHLERTCRMKLASETPDYKNGAKSSHYLRAPRLPRSSHEEYFY